MGSWSTWKTGEGKTALINMGYGIELADEQAVCGAICQEFMMSPSLAGMWQAEEETNVRFFGISREEPYETDGSRQKRTDLVIEKYEQQSDGSFMVEKLRSYIEAKRARQYTTKLADGKIETREPQIAAICDDISKLRCRRKAMKGPIYLHLLVWGMCEKDCDYSDDPTELFDLLRERARGSLTGPHLRWLPTKWDPPTPSCTQPVVKRSAWIALAEVDKEGAKEVAG